MRAVFKPGFPDGYERPDLSNHLLLWGLGIFVGVSFLIIAIAPWAPGSPMGQSAGIIGSLLLCAPAVFSVMKRSGKSKTPPLWFMIHVVASFLGLVFIALHVANGNWISPPGLVLAALYFVILQGTLARAFLGRRLSYLFAKSVSSFNFTKPLVNNREPLRKVISEKQKLLCRLDEAAEEALFSPTLKHWLSHPILSFRYQCLIAEESRLVGARAHAGWLLRAWRRVHIAVACLFLLGLMTHVVVMVFFAGYAAEARDITWWHLFAWGGE